MRAQRSSEITIVAVAIENPSELSCQVDVRRKKSDRNIQQYCIHRKHAKHHRPEERVVSDSEPITNQTDRHQRADVNNAEMGPLWSSRVITISSPPTLPPTPSKAVGTSLSWNVLPTFVVPSTAFFWTRRLTNSAVRVLSRSHLPARRPANARRIKECAGHEVEIVGGEGKKLTVKGGLLPCRTPRRRPAQSIRSRPRWRRSPEAEAAAPACRPAGVHGQPRARLGGSCQDATFRTPSLTSIRARLSNDKRRSVYRCSGPHLRLDRAT